MTNDPTAHYRRIPDAEQRLALCNDGSDAGFYYLPALSASKSDKPSTTWLLFQQGGDWCWDDKSCSKRTEYFTSSKNREPHKTLNGLFASHRFQHTHRIFLPYCTSDAYLGNRSDGPLGWQFRGRSVVVAVIEEMQKLGMGDVAGTRLLYGGCSAGARGASYNIDWLSRNILPANVSVRGFLDSALWIELKTPKSNPHTSIRQEARANAVLHEDQLDKACVKDNPKEKWRCLFGETLLHYVMTPSFIHTYQDDSHQLYKAFGHWGEPSTPEEHAFADTFRRRMLVVLFTIPARHSIFSAACWDHCIQSGCQRSIGNSYCLHTLELRVNNTVMMDAVANFFFHDIAIHDIQRCDGFNCCDQVPVFAELGHTAIYPQSWLWFPFAAQALAIALIWLVAHLWSRQHKLLPQRLRKAGASK